MNKCRNDAGGCDCELCPEIPMCIKESQTVCVYRANVENCPRTSNHAGSCCKRLSLYVKWCECD